ncbi:serine/threonine protein phosphatase 2B catalytic subunit, putative [Entamoeba invadens IP1]|uniref:Serine/threonine-protein phosphatase n=1 Tax=Entamoeba invadens IP1 TaxID=370355 RepID=A0A0A1TZW0_ENTIV|nr:serine/threonine protein phosphatase 2B catalytic subunit, putative [Entamoeba invadens IP1]ELP87136.1 serine/threonine protein phosphatase 2B catalytic subunit, putative [Entamoeba invadens IP1]|eukprot:XP_004253907.1 serine/threonine protein phosphatase 2B catalytic subunit, putative [Entamoeba invadens IP1]
MEHIDLPLNDTKYNVDQIIQLLNNSTVFSESSVLSLIEKSRDILSKEPNTIVVKNYKKCCVFGDIHGNYRGLIKQLTNKDVVDCDLNVFLGDYVDRGNNSINVLITLLCLKVNHPDTFILLRGNHEERLVTSMYGFREECSRVYSEDFYDKCCELFCAFPICAVISTKKYKYFLVHAGISPLIKSLQDVDEIDRFTDVCEDEDNFTDDAFADLLWSDPIPRSYLSDDWKDKKFMNNRERACSVYYGYAALNEFLEKNGLRSIIRGHQAVSEGFALTKLGDEKREEPMVYTVFGAQGYYKESDKAAVLIMDYETSELNHVVFGKE